jgi:hypothetical protein
LASIYHAGTIEDEGGAAPDARRGRPQYATQCGPRAEAPAEGQKDCGWSGLRRLNLPVHRPHLSAANFTRDTTDFICDQRESFIKEQFMRKLPKPTEQEIKDGPQTVSFQIANGNARQGCILQTKFPTKVQAQKYLLTNWPIIERMARDALATGTFEDGQIKLVMI